MAELEAAFSPKTKVMILNTPHNPTGKVSVWVGVHCAACVYQAVLCVRVPCSRCRVFDLQC